MDPISGTDAKRKRRKEPPQNPQEGHLNYLKKKYTFRIRHVEIILQAISEGWLSDILIIIKKYYEQVVKSIDSMLKLQVFNGSEELNKTWRNPILPLVKNIRKDKTIIGFFLKAPPHLEGILPSLTEKWLKDMIFGIREDIVLKLEDEKTQIYVNGIYDATFKIVIYGDSSASKTSVILRYISGYFMQDLKLTLGVGFYSKTTLINGKKVKLQIRDVGNRFLLPTSAKGAITLINKNKS